MAAIGGVGAANTQALELLQEQTERMTELLQTVATGGMDFAEKLVKLNAQAQVEAASQQTTSQALNLYI